MGLPSLVSRAVSLPKELLARSGQASVETETDSTMASSPELPSEREDSQKGLEELISSGELGEIKDFDTYLTAEQDETAYYYIMDSAMGPITIRETAGGRIIYTEAAIPCVPTAAAPRPRPWSSPAFLLQALRRQRPLSGRHPMDFTPAVRVHITVSLQVR